MVWLRNRSKIRYRKKKEGPDVAGVADDHVLGLEVAEEEAVVVEVQKRGQELPGP